MRNLHLFILGLLLTPSILLAEDARGIVFEDTNRNGHFDAGEKGLSGVAVSTDLDIVVTDSDGRFAIPVDDDTIIFVVKPTGYFLPINEQNLPRFFYIHRPAGSAPVHYGGVAPTGSLPEQIEFPLLPVDESGTIRAVLLADPQPQNAQEIDYIRRDVLSELPMAHGNFIMTLGDIMFDHLNLFADFNSSVAPLGLTHFGVLGNHDQNYDAPSDRDSEATFNRIFGPSTYSFNWGSAHFIVLDSIRHTGDKDQPRRYKETLEPWQLEWMKKDLALVPAENLVVLCSHAPIWSPGRKDPLIGNARLLYDALKGRRNVLAVNGHTHNTSQHTFGEADGWKEAGRFHQSTLATVCGAWWSGPKDIRGIPVANMTDGGPNGYTLLDITGGEYTIRYRAAGFGPDYQMAVYTPSLHNRDTSTLLVNVFDGMPDAAVEYSIDGGGYAAMELKPQNDPVAEALYSDSAPARKGWVKPRVCRHIWEAKMPVEKLSKGQHLVRVRYEDWLGRKYEGAAYHTQ